MRIQFVSGSGKSQTGSSPLVLSVTVQSRIKTSKLSHIKLEEGGLESGGPGLAFFQNVSFSCMVLLLNGNSKIKDAHVRVISVI